MAELRQPGRLIFEDARQAPGVFNWNGPIDADRLAEWMQRSAFGSVVPADLVAFWRETGGGDMYEGETILGPFADVRLGDDVTSTNEFHHARGLPARYLVFCTGVFLGAVDTTKGRYVDLQGSSYLPLDSFPTLEAWYIATERAEFGSRYGLPALP